MDIWQNFTNSMKKQKLEQNDLDETIYTSDFTRDFLNECEDAWIIPVSEPVFTDQQTPDWFV